MKKLFSALLLLALLILPSQARAEFEPMIFIWNTLTPEEKNERASSPLPYVKEDAPKGGLLRLSAVGSFDNFNPFSPRGLSAAWSSVTYETLADDDGYGDNGMRGLLAESFEVAPDRSWLTVRLRPEGRFQDGVPVTADDVKFSFEALVNEGSPSYRNYYANVKSVEVLSEHEVRFHFTEANNRELPLIVTQLPVLPKHWWEGKSVGDPQPEMMPGSGPYRLVSYEMGDSLTYERDPDWWGKDLPLNRGLYNFDRVRIDYYRSIDVAREAFLAGQCDLYQERTIAKWFASYDVPAVKDGRLVREEIPIDRPQGMSGFFFNTRRDFFSDPRVRRAIALCFDFEWTNSKLFHNAYTRCDSFFSNSPMKAPNEPSEAELALLEKYRGLLDEAVFGPLPVWPESDGSGSVRSRLPEILGLFEAAGWTLKNGKMVDANGRQFKFTLTLVSPGMQRVAMPLRQNLERIGVIMEVETPDQTQYVTRVRQFDYDLIMGTVRQSTNPGNEQRNFWGSRAASSNGSRNYMGIKDPVIDEIIEAVISAPSKDEQVAAVQALDRLLLHGSYCIPGWYSGCAFVARWADHVSRPEKNPPQGLDMLSWYPSEAQLKDSGAKQ